MIRSVLGYEGFKLICLLLLLGRFSDRIEIYYPSRFGGPIWFRHWNERRCNFSFFFWSILKVFSEENLLSRRRRPGTRAMNGWI